MRLLSLLAALALVFHPLAFGQDISAQVARAVADPARAAADQALDAGRHPAALLAFAGVSKGDKVVDLMPGGGYFTALFSAMVGEQGKVYALQPREMDKAAPDGLQRLRALAGSPGRANVTVLLEPIDALAVPEPVQLVWTSQNYHDLHVPFMGVGDIARVNRAIFAMLAPGGVLIVVDHAAPPSSGFSQSDALHRIDPQTVRDELLAAGFEFVGESAALRNPADPHSVPVFDPSVKGKTDRFVYKFRKPVAGGAGQR